MKTNSRKSKCLLQCPSNVPFDERSIQGVHGASIMLDVLTYLKNNYPSTFARLQKNTDDRREFFSFLEDVFIFLS